MRVSCLLERMSSVDSCDGVSSADQRQHMGQQHGNGREQTPGSQPCQSTQTSAYVFDSSDANSVIDKRIRGVEGLMGVGTLG